MMRMLTVFEVIMLHSKLIARTGGCPGIRDAGLIERVVNRHHEPLESEFCPTAEESVASFVCNLVRCRGFVDGNKRLGIAAMLVILRLNRYPLQREYPKEDLIELADSVAKGDAGEAEMIRWIREHREGGPDGAPEVRRRCGRYCLCDDCRDRLIRL